MQEDEEAEQRKYEEEKAKLDQEEEQNPRATVTDTHEKTKPIAIDYLFQRKMTKVIAQQQSMLSKTMNQGGYQPPLITLATTIETNQQHMTG